MLLIILFAQEAATTKITSNSNAQLNIRIEIDLNIADRTSRILSEYFTRASKKARERYFQNPKHLF